MPRSKAKRTPLGLSESTSSGSRITGSAGSPRRPIVEIIVRPNHRAHVPSNHTTSSARYDQGDHDQTYGAKLKSGRRLHRRDPSNRLDDHDAESLSERHPHNSRGAVATSDDEGDELNLTSPHASSSNKPKELSSSPTLVTARVGPPRKRQRHDSQPGLFEPLENDNAQSRMNTRKGKQRAYSSDYSTSAHSKLSSAPGQRNSVPTWETLRPPTTSIPTGPDGVSERASMSPSPGFSNECANCTEVFITQRGVNSVYCSRCRHDVLKRNGFIDDTEDESMSRSPKAGDKGPEPIVDEQDEREVESAMLQPATSRANSHPDSENIEPEVQTRVSRLKEPPVGDVPKTFPDRFTHMNDLLYHLAGITNPIQASQPASTHISFHGIITRPLDITRYPSFPTITERLLNEIASDVKAKVFLPFILPRKQFKKDGGSCLGVVYSCQCKENSSDEPCPGILQVAVTAKSFDDNSPAIKINVALEH